MSQRITQIQFAASLQVGAQALASVFASLPHPEEFEAWESREAMQKYCQGFPAERADVGGYYVPTVPEIDSGVVDVVTPSSNRVISFWGPKQWENETVSVEIAEAGGFWTVDFPEGGSIHQAGKVLAALPPGVEVTNIATQNIAEKILQAS